MAQYERKRATEKQKAAWARAASPANLQRLAALRPSANAASRAGAVARKNFAENLFGRADALRQTELAHGMTPASSKHTKKGYFRSAFGPVSQAGPQAVSLLLTGKGRNKRVRKDPLDMFKALMLTMREQGLTLKTPAQMFGALVQMRNANRAKFVDDLGYDQRHTVPWAQNKKAQQAIQAALAAGNGGTLGSPQTAAVQARAKAHAKAKRAARSAMLRGLPTSTRGGFSAL